MVSYHQIATSCATPGMVKLFLALSAISAFINFGVSMWQVTYQDDGLIDSVNSATFDDWQKYCDGEESTDGNIMYLRPFGFNWEFANDKGFAFCPWPITNSAYRGVVTIISALLAVMMFFPSRISVVGPFLTHVFAILFFSIFTLDANSLTLGNGVCEDGFSDTVLLDAVDNAGSIECQPGMFVFTLFMDVCCSCLFMWTGSIWRRTGSIYGGSGAAEVK